MHHRTCTQPNRPTTESAMLILSAILIATLIDANCAESHAEEESQTATGFGKGSWYLSTNATPSNWSKTGMYYENPWNDQVDVGDNMTLELYVKALTPHTIEVLNAKLLGVNMVGVRNPAHTNEAVSTGAAALGNYVQLTDQQWTKVSIPLADFEGLNIHALIYFAGLPQSYGTGEYALGVDEVRFVGGSTPVLWYGDAHPNNPINTHGDGMEARYVATGGVDRVGDTGDTPVLVDITNGAK